MPKYELTARIRTGQKVNLITGADHDTIAVYSDEELRERLAAAKADPRDLDVTYRRIG